MQVSGRLAADTIQTSYQGSRVLELGTRASLLKPARRFLSARQALTEPRPERCLLVWHLGLLRLVPFFRMRGRMVCVFLHGVEAWGKHSGLTLKMLSRVDHYLTNSRYTWDRFVEAHPEFQSKPHAVVHLGLGNPFRADLPRSGKRPTAIMISRLEQTENYKGHQQVLRAWPQLLDKVPTARLVIVGDGNLKPSLERLAVAEGVDHAVEFLGQVSDEQKEQMILAARCVALPSRAEGFGLVYVEGMRLGRPSLVSSLDAGREVVNPPEAGLSADPDDLDDLSERLAELMDGPGWSEKSEASLRRYQNNFTQAHFADRLTRALQEILS